MSVGDIRNSPFLMAAGLCLLLNGTAFGQTAPAQTDAEATRSRVESRLSFDAQESEITFTLGAFLHTVHGTADLISGQITWTVGDEACSGQLIIDAKSLATGNAKRDRIMHTKVLDSELFDTIEFACESFTGAVDSLGIPEGPFTVRGSFSMHGSRHPMSIPMVLQRTGDRATLSGELEIPYVEWGMSDPSKPFLRAAKVVNIQLELVASGISGSS